MDKQKAEVELIVELEEGDRQESESGESAGGEAKSGRVIPHDETDNGASEASGQMSAAATTVNDLTLSSSDGCLRSVSLIGRQLIVNGNVDHKQIPDPLPDPNNQNKWLVKIPSERQQDSAIGRQFVQMSGGLGNVIGLNDGGTERMNFMFALSLRLDTGRTIVPCTVMVGQAHTSMRNRWALGGPNLAPDGIWGDNGCLTVFTGSGDLEALFKVHQTEVNAFSFQRLLSAEKSGRSYADWMGSVPGNQSIGKLNLPGTHDSAAINRMVRTPFECQDRSIAGQLEGGIRALDLRVKIKKAGGKYIYQMCHGNPRDFIPEWLLWTYPGINEYPQTLENVLDEVDAFLSSHTNEFVAVSLKVDDWNLLQGEEAAVLNELADRLKKRAKIAWPAANGAWALPQLNDVRGRVYLVNRINNDRKLGAPIAFPHNTDGAVLQKTADRDYTVYIQDRYEWSGSLQSKADAQKKKAELFEDAMTKTNALGSDLVINFASGVFDHVNGVYIESLWLKKMGASAPAQRPERMGWCFFDFEGEVKNTTTYGPMRAVEMVIDSNLTDGSWTPPAPPPTRYTRFGQIFVVQA